MKRPLALALSVLITTSVVAQTPSASAKPKTRPPQQFRSGFEDAPGHERSHICIYTLLQRLLECS